MKGRRAPGAADSRTRKQWLFGSLVGRRRRHCPREVGNVSVEEREVLGIERERVLCACYASWSNCLHE